MYLLSSYVLGGIVTALVLTPFVSAPDRSFIGTLLATAAPEQTVSVNRALKGDRRAPASLVAEGAAPQTVIPKNPRSSKTNTPASFTAPRRAPGTPETDPRLTNDSPTGKSRLLDGCESAFSAITDRQFADIPGRCLAALRGAPVRTAALN